MKEKEISFEEEEEISTSRPRTGSVSTDEASQGNFNNFIFSVSSSSLKASDIIKIFLTPDEDYVEFKVEARKKGEPKDSKPIYTWNVYHTYEEIKANYHQIFKELKKRNSNALDKLTDRFKEMRSFQVISLKTEENLNQITTEYEQFLNDDEIKLCIKLLEFFTISATSFGEYNYGDKPIEGYAMKKADPRCMRRVFGWVCKCIECIMFKQWNNRWFILRRDMIYYTNGSTIKDGKNVYFFDDQTEIKKEQNDLSIRVSNSSAHLVLQFPNRFLYEYWFNEIQKRIIEFKTIVKQNVYSAFTNQKNFNKARWYIDGEDYFKDLHFELLKAKESVFITDWWLSPEVYLERPVDFKKYRQLPQNGTVNKDPPLTRLMDLLYQLAENGVLVYVQVYHEMKLALTLNSLHSKNTLKNMHNNIKVLRHPKKALDLLWSHHEKLVIIDQSVAFVGGLDLCWGRYDSHDHPLIEPENDEQIYYFPGIDYSNARICDFMNVDKYLVESVNRNQCRMPWHDVHIRLKGPVVADIARHFVQRWNFSKFEVREEVITNIKGNQDVPENKVQFGGNKKKKGGWLSGIINNLNEEENKEKDENLIPKNEGAAKKKFGFLMKKEIELSSKNEEDKEEEKKEEAKKEESEDIKISTSSLMIMNINKEAETDDQELGEFDRLEKNLHKGKTFIDNDHLLKINIEDANVNPQPAQSEGVYNKFVKMIAKSKKKNWFTTDRKEDHLKNKFKFAGNFFGQGRKAKCQVLRSSSTWSVGLQNTECSILKGYYNLIDNSKHYLFIENQFFVSKAYNEEERRENKKDVSRVVENEIAFHIRKRIERAYNSNEKFRVYVFIPLLPGFAGEPESSGTLQIIFKHTLASISNNRGLSMIEMLNKIIGEDKYKDYISFFSLRNHCVLNGVPKTELIYIHSKLMIVDDKAVLIGSANINDRSMLGSRDSEFAVIVEEEETFNSLMDGNYVKVAEFAAGFRKRLMAEHLGIKADDPVLIDPVSDELWNLMNGRANKNTLIYRQVFGCYPDNTYTNFEKLNEATNKKKKEDVSELQQLYDMEKDNIVGHIVEFPYHFLEDENLGISFFSVENIVPERNFT